MFIHWPGVYRDRIYSYIVSSCISSLEIVKAEPELMFLSRVVRSVHGAVHLLSCLLHFELGHND